MQLLKLKLIILKITKNNEQNFQTLLLNLEPNFQKKVVGLAMFKVFVHNMEKMKELVNGTGPIGKPIYDECVNKMDVWDLTKIDT